VEFETDQHDLKSAGLKATFPRLKILDIFRRSSERHLSAEDVYRFLLVRKSGNRTRHCLSRADPV